MFDRIRALPGYGDEKAKIFLAILGKRLKVAPKGWEEYAAPFSDDKPRSVADIDSPEKALEYKTRYGVDGVMIGRASIGYPWIFREVKHFVATGELLAPPTLEERVAACQMHFDRSIEWKGP